MHFCILLDFLCELYYDARIHEHQVIVTSVTIDTTKCVFILLVQHASTLTGHHQAIIRWCIRCKK
jgi:hypothetical protein